MMDVRCNTVEKIQEPQTSDIRAQKDIRYCGIKDRRLKAESNVVSRGRSSDILLKSVSDYSIGKSKE